MVSAQRKRPSSSRRGVSSAVPGVACRMRFAGGGVGGVSLYGYPEGVQTGCGEWRGWVRAVRRVCRVSSRASGYS
jgi:hypothetical protein